MNRSFYERYPKRYQLTTFDARLQQIEFRLSLLSSDDDWLTSEAWCTNGYALKLRPRYRQSANIDVHLRAPREPPEFDGDTSHWWLSMTPHVQRRATIAVAQGLLGYSLARPPPLGDFDVYMSRDPFLVDLYQQWSFSRELLLSLRRPLHELLDSFAASLESYLTIESIYARVNGLRPPRKRR